MMSSMSHSGIAEPIAPMAWHTLEAEKSLYRLETDRETGLTSEAVIERIERYGANELTETAGRSPLEILWDQFKTLCC